LIAVRSLVVSPSSAPDINLIEQAFAKFKWLLIDVAEQTVESVWRTCRRLVGLSAETECRNHIRHSGSRYTHAGCARGMFSSTEPLAVAQSSNSFFKLSSLSARIFHLCPVFECLAFRFCGP